MRSRWSIGLCSFVLVLLVTVGASAQNQGAAGSAQAIAEDQQRVKDHPSDGPAWEKLGTDLLLAGKYAEAVEPLQKALDNGVPPQLGKYNLACAYARIGDKSKALDLLESLATSTGFPGPIAGDPDLASLKGEPRFQKLVQAAQLAAAPCKDPGHPEYRQLDFWVGEWDVFAGPQKVGESSVQLILKDCVVFENWKGLQGGSGKSFNKYNNVTRQWEQFWVSDSGTTNYFHGALADGAMRYALEMPGPNGGTLMRHLTFTPLAQGKVRQFSQGSTDGGKTWNTEYDLVYVKKP